jgi:hypothetical protein
MNKFYSLLVFALASFSMSAQNNNANFNTTQCTGNNGLPNFCYNAGFDDGAASVTPDTVFVCDYTSYAIAIETMSQEIIDLQAQLAAYEAASRNIPVPYND